MWLQSSSLRDVKQTNKLYSKLLSDYNRDVRPVADAEASLDVSFGLSVIEVLGIDENNGHMTTNIWLKMVKFILITHSYVLIIHIGKSSS